MSFYIYYIIYQHNKVPSVLVYYPWMLELFLTDVHYKLNLYTFMMPQRDNLSDWNGIEWKDDFWFLFLFVCNRISICPY